MQLDFSGDLSVKKKKGKWRKGRSKINQALYQQGELRFCPRSPCERRVHFSITHGDGALSWVAQEVAVARGPQEGSRRGDAPKAQGGAACIDFHSIYWSN